MNSVTLMGRLTKDPETRQGANGSVVRFGIAVDRWGGKDKGVDFFDCAAFGKTGEALSAYGRKGTKILLSGRIQNNAYTDHNGMKKTAVQIIVSEWEFAESKRQEAPAEAPAFIDVPADGIEELPFN